MHFQSLCVCERQTHGKGPHVCTWTHTNNHTHAYNAHSQAAEILAKANERYTAKDLMSAMKLYEDALNEVRMDTKPRFLKRCWQRA